MKQSKRIQALLRNVCRHVLGSHRSEKGFNEKLHIEPKENPKERLLRLLKLPGYAEVFVSMPEAKLIPVPVLETVEPQISPALASAMALQRHKKDRAAMVQSRKEAKAAILALPEVVELVPTPPLLVEGAASREGA